MSGSTAEIAEVLSTDSLPSTGALSARGARGNGLRDRYRHAVEKTAKKSRLSESEVAAEAVRLAHESAARKDDERGGDNRSALVGYYLIDKGLAQLEHLAGARLSISDALGIIARRFPLLLYAGALTLIAAAFAVTMLARAHTGGLYGWMLLLTGILSLLCASHLSVALVNWCATLLVIFFQEWPFV